MQTLTEKQLGHALFYAIKMQDFEHAEYLLSIDAPVNTSFFIDQDTLVYTANMMVGKAANTIKKYGVSHSNSQLVLRILDKFIEQKCDLRCHCNPKNPHYCALSQALRYIDFKTQDGMYLNDVDLLVEQNLLVLKLLYHGATYKNLTNEKGFKWNAIDILNSFIETKKDDVIQLIKLNRHAKGCGNRHLHCTTNKLIQTSKNQRK